MDEIAEWTDAYERVSTFAARLDAEQAARPVPACPDWSVQDLLAHVIGLDVDVVAGDEPDDHNAAWTQRQVESRRGRSVSDLLTEWAGVAEPLRAWMAAHTTRPLADIVIHEQDLRGAIGLSGAQDTDGLYVVRERMTGRFLTALGELGTRAPIALVGPGWQWCSAGAVEDAAVEVCASDFDLARALMARRSAQQLRLWTTRGDVEPYLGAFATLGALPERDLAE